MAERDNRRQAPGQVPTHGALDDGTWAFGFVDTSAFGTTWNGPDVTAVSRHAGHPAGAAGEIPAAIQQIVFIDGSIADAERLAAGVAAGVRAVILDPTRDGVQQIAEYLTQHRAAGLAAIDIVAHAQDGLVALGSTLLTSDTIPQYQAALAAIGAALRPGGDIQIYGCDVAQDASGVAFLQQLSVATGEANIAASSHLIGASDQGGNWDLNVDVGTVDVASPFTAATLNTFPDVLALTKNQLFVTFNNGQSNTWTRVEQIGVVGATASGTVDVRDGTQTTNFAYLQGLVVDAPLGKYFMVNSDNNTVNQIVSASVAGGAPTVLYSAPTIVDYEFAGLALDQAGGKLYFAQASTDPAQDGIYRISVTGGAATPVVVNQGIVSPLGLSLDVGDNLVFFVDNQGIGSGVNNLDVGNLSNGTLTVLNSQLGATVQAALNTNKAQLVGVAVDPTANIMYFTAENGGTVANNYIFSAPYTVSAGKVTVGTVTTMYSGAGAGTPTGIAIDPQNGVFYVGSASTQAVNEGSLTHTGAGSVTQVFQLTGTAGVQPNGLFLLSTPTIAASGTVTFVQGGSAITIAPSLTVTNSDGQGLASATVQVAGGSFAADGDTLAATTAGTGITAVYTASTETLTLTGADTLTNYQTVLRSVTLSSTGVTAGNRTINWTISDGVITSPTPTSTVVVHDKPTVTAGATVTFTGGGTSVALDSALTIADVSSTTLASATVVIGGFISGDTLTVGTAGGLSTSFSSGTLTLTGSASLATYQTALDSVTYGFSPSNGDPTGGGTHTSRSISWSVNDGVVSSATASSTLNTVHAAPTITASGTVSFTGGSNTPVVLNAGLAVADPDSGGNISSATVTVGSFISGDLLNFTNQNGIAGSYNSATGVLVLSGTATVASYQTALESVTYSFNPSNGDPTGGGSHTSRTVSWLVNDGVSTGSGSSGLTTVHVAATVVAGASVIYPENAAPVVLDPTLTVSDPDSGGNLAGATVSISSGFLAGDTLHFSNQNGITGSYNSGTGVLTLSGTATLANYQAALQSVTYSFAGDPTNGGIDNGRTIRWLVNDGAGNSTPVTSSLTTLCFCAGSLIATPGGEVMVERLQVGDIVLTASGAVRTIVWIGVGRVMVTRGRRSAATPVIVRKGALADNVPHHDLRVTKSHALFLDDVLIPVEFLVNHRSILWDDQAQEVSLYHIELDVHDVLLANGAPAESYRDDGNRWLFRNANSGWHLPPQPPCAPVLTGGATVDGVWRRLLERAGRGRPLPLTDDPDLHLLVDGRRIDPVVRRGQAVVFQLPARPESVHIVSREAVPAELGLARDPRSLGVALQRIVVRQGTRFRLVEAADHRLADGFHAYEPAGGLRWTNGDARVPAALFAEFDAAPELVLHLSGTTSYPLLADAAARSAA